MMNELKKIRLDSRMAVISPSGEIYLAPFFRGGAPDGVYVLYSSYTGRTAVVAVREGWRTLPVVYPTRVFAGRLTARCYPGDKVVVIWPDRPPEIATIELSGAPSVPVVKGVPVPLWETVRGRDLARHPACLWASLWVSRDNRIYEKLEDDKATSSPSHEEDDI